jgi:LEA14-like dessication related protein
MNNDHKSNFYSFFIKQANRINPSTVSRQENAPMNMISPRSKKIAWFVAAMALCFAGCATMSGVEAPSVSLAGLRIAEVKGLEAVFEVDLRVLNPNKTPLNIQGIDCDMAFNERHLARGVANPRKEIPAYGSGVVTVSIYASMLDLFGAAHRLIQAAQSETPDERWTYAIKGSLDLGDSWFKKIPFDAKGEINLKDLMPATP